MHFKTLSISVLMLLSCIMLQAQIITDTDVIGLKKGQEQNISVRTSIKQYHVGEIYDDGNVKGLVVKVDASGQHGLLMSLDRFDGKWVTNKKLKIVTSVSEKDGAVNMAAIEQFLTENKQYEGTFPFYDWCRLKGDGWYIPSREEIKAVATALNGIVGSYNDEKFSEMDRLVREKGGDSLYGKVKLPMGGKMPLSMLTSSESPDGKLYIFGCLVKSPFSAPEVLVELGKRTFGRNMGSRAVRKF